jgi:hypothetical protein
VHTRRVALNTSYEMLKLRLEGREQQTMRGAHQLQTKKCAHRLLVLVGAASSTGQGQFKRVEEQ